MNGENGKRPPGRPRNDGLPPQGGYKSDAGLRRKRRFLRFIDTVKVRAGCFDCGYRASPNSLDFHHARGEKEVEISTLFSIERAIEEMPKCIVLCSNCHRAKTAQQAKAERKMLDQRCMFEDDLLDDDFGDAVVRAMHALGLKTRHSDPQPQMELL